MTAKTSHPEIEKGAALEGLSLVFSILFEQLRSNAGVAGLVVWGGNDELVPVFSCSSGAPGPDASGSPRKHLLAKRALTSKRSVISKGKQPADKAEAGNAEAFFPLDDRHVAQVIFSSELKDAELDECIAKTQAIVDSMGRQSSMPLFAQAPQSSQVQSNGLPTQKVVGESNAASTADVLVFFRNINQSLDSKSAAFHIANELRQITDSDRVVVFQSRGRGFSALAASGVSVVNRKSKEIRQLQKLIREIAGLRRKFAYPTEEPESMPRDLERALSNYLADQSTRSLMVIPVFENAPAKTDEPDKRRKDRRKNRVIGLISIEHFQSQVESDAIATNERFGQCAADSFRNALWHRRLFLYPVWNFLGRAYDFLIGRHFTGTAIGVTALLACLLAAFFWQAEYRLSCRGELRPELSRTIYAEIDGLVLDVFTDTGASVEKGQKLVRLENKELLIRQQELQGNMSALLERIESIDRFSVGDPRNPGQDAGNREQIAMERSGLKKQVETIKTQLEVVDRQIAMQEISSPVSGEVLTSNLQRELADRPVSRGAELLDVAATDGEWVLDLKLPDKKIGELLKAQEALGDSLTVTFILASEPEKTHTGQIKSVELATETDQDLGQYLRLIVDIEEEPFVDAKVGSEVIAYVECGKRSLGFIWTKDIVDFVRRRVIFPFL